MLEEGEFWQGSSKILGKIVIKYHRKIIRTWFCCRDWKDKIDFLFQGHTIYKKHRKRNEPIPRGWGSTLCHHAWSASGLLFLWQFLMAPLQFSREHYTLYLCCHLSVSSLNTVCFIPIATKGVAAWQHFFFITHLKCPRYHFTTTLQGFPRWP